jgi:hypothetical protein
MRVTDENAVHVLELLASYCTTNQKFNVVRAISSDAGEEVVDWTVPQVLVEKDLTLTVKPYVTYRAKTLVEALQLTVDALLDSISEPFSDTMEKLKSMVEVKRQITSALDPSIPVDTSSAEETLVKLQAKMSDLDAL